MTPGGSTLMLFPGRPASPGEPHGYLRPSQNGIVY